MSGADTIERAAVGRLPAWAEMRPSRRRHASRVVTLLDRWATRLQLSPEERTRWRAAGWLHDALRDADPSSLRDAVPPGARELPDPLLHGPAAAARLVDDGVDDAAVLDAIAYHTLGHPDLGRLGRALYVADYLEPGRGFAPVARASLRARMPESFDAVLAAAVEARITHLLGQRVPLHRYTLDFWNTIVVED